MVETRQTLWYECTIGFLVIPQTCRCDASTLEDDEVEEDINADMLIDDIQPSHIAYGRDVDGGREDILFRLYFLKPVLWR